jgi:hypothetical protein
VHVTVELKNRNGWLITCVGTYSKQIDVCPSPPSRFRICDIGIALNVEAGEYSVKVSLGSDHTLPNRGMVIDETADLGPIRVEWNYDVDIAPHLGLVGLPFSATVVSAST